ncbi:MAG: alkaline phosphatase family protein [Verrucomicrobiaceae bacterium]|nr:alkaline phosphatase family protein [Verrucomicrobiaceae bacterium]
MKIRHPQLLLEAKSSASLSRSRWSGASWATLASPKATTYSQLAQHIIRTKKPAFLAIHLVCLDALEHATGRQSAEAYWAANDSDNRVADLVRATEEAGIRDKTTFVITTDHGFVTYTKTVNPNAMLRRGLRKDRSAGQVAGRRLSSFRHVPGRRLFCVCPGHRKSRPNHRPNHAKTRRHGRVEAVIPSSEFAARIGHRTADQDPREPDICLSAKDGYSFSDSLADTADVSTTDSPKGSHGYLQTNPDLYGCCVISGAGIKPGTTLETIQNIDIAPTIARLLGIEMPTADGKVLIDALIDPKRGRRRVNSIGSGVQESS